MALLNNKNKQLTYKRMCVDGLFSVACSPIITIIFVRFLRTVAITEKLQIKEVYKLDLYTCNAHPSPHNYKQDFNMCMILCIQCQIKPRISQ